LPEVTLGLLPGNGGTQRLSAIVGPNKALELMISGVRLSPEEAHRLGILNRLLKSSELAGRTREFAKTLAGSATLAVGRINRSVYDGFCHSLDAGMAIECRNISVLFSSNDAKEGFSAFAERRKPQYSGRSDLRIPYDVDCYFGLKSEPGLNDAPFSSTPPPGT
jgi:enoyl-CoA hydratase/carnithine racemase